MAKRSIIILPKFHNIEKIEKLREKYDPLYGFIKPHITVVFPFESDIEEQDLKKHVKNALKDIKSFNLKLKGITGTSDNYLFLNMKEGNDSIIEIHDKLYTGILKDFLYRKVSYIPHITVGKIKDDKKYRAVFDETENIEDTFETIVKEISIETIDDNENSNIEFTIEL